MRCVKNCLGNSLEALESQLIQHQRKDDGNREAPQQAEETQQYRILHHAPKSWSAEETLEPFQTNPFTPHESAAGLVIPKRNLYAVHWYVLVNNGKYNGNCQHGI